MSAQFWNRASIKQKIPVTILYILCLAFLRLFFRHTDKFIRCQSVNGCYHIANLSTDVMKNAPDNSKSIERCCGKIPQHKTELVALGNTIAKGYFKKPESLKAVFPSLDNFKYLDKHYVFNVGAMNYVL